MGRSCSSARSRSSVRDGTSASAMVLLVETCSSGRTTPETLVRGFSVSAAPLLLIGSLSAIASLARLGFFSRRFLAGLVEVENLRLSHVRFRFVLRDFSDLSDDLRHALRLGANDLCDPRGRRRR